MHVPTVDSWDLRYSQDGNLCEFVAPCVYIVTAEASGASWGRAWSMWVSQRPLLYTSTCSKLSCGLPATRDPAFLCGPGPRRWECGWSLGSGPEGASHWTGAASGLLGGHVC